MKQPQRRLRRGLPLNAIAPNAVTALALCSGLTSVRFAIAGEWEKALIAIIVAGVLDGMDGRIARMLKGETRFGAELDSLSDVIAFGVSPAIVIYLWSLQYLPRFGWLIALMLALSCALRLARFNARIDISDQPHKSAGFLTGVPAPVGAGLALLPIFLWLWTEFDGLREYWVTGPWLAFIALLMISNTATYSWSSLRLRRHIRLEAIGLAGLLGAAILSVPWIALSLISLIYLATIPFSIRAYARVKRSRAAAAAATPAAT